MLYICYSYESSGAKLIMDWNLKNCEPKEISPLYPFPISGVLLSSWKVDEHKSDIVNLKLSVFSRNTLSRVFTESDLSYEATLNVKTILSVSMSF